MATYYAKEMAAIHYFYDNGRVPSNNSAGGTVICIGGNDSDSYYNAYLKYDLSDVPYKSKIVSAKLRMYCYKYYTSNQTGTFNVYRATNEWYDDVDVSEPMVATESSMVDNQTSVSLNTWTDWDITGLVQGWVNQDYKNYGFSIRRVEGTDTEWWVYNRRYNTGQYATYIEIEYEPAEEVRITKTRMTEIADAIRAKKETTAILSPAQMVAEIESIVIGDNLPNAEDEYFGTAADEAEYGIVAHGSVSYNNNMTAHYGHQFTVNETFAILGLRAYMYVGKTATLQLWDSSGKSIKSMPLTAQSTGWNEVRFAEPFNLMTGETYTVSIRFTDCHYTSLSSCVFNSKITSKGLKYADGGNVNTYPNKSMSGNVFYGIEDIIIGEPIGATVIDEYKIQLDTMTDIADEVKRITGVTGTMTTAQIITALQGIATQTTEATE